MPTSFIATGGQIGYASTAISFDTASMLPTCGGVAGVPNATATAASSATASETSGPKGRLSGGATAGVVIGVVGLVAVVVVFVCWWHRGHGGTRFKTSLAWDPQMDPTGMIRRFPLVRDDDGRCLPLLLAAFEKCHLMKEILPRAVAAFGLCLSGVVDLLRTGVNPDQAEDETLRSNAIHIYTRPEIYREANRLMRLDPDHNEPGAPLWPFVAILQLALVREMKDSTGEPLYRGGLISRAELNEVRSFIAAGGEGKILLRSFTSCSPEKDVAVTFARNATPTATMARVSYEITPPPVSCTKVVAPHHGLPYGPAVPIKYISKF
jgi:hypothetical protein